MGGATISRRGVLSGAACLICSGIAARGGEVGRAPTCDDLEAEPELALDATQRERHTLFLLLAMALVYDGWTVDQGKPDDVAAYAAVEPDRRFPDYAGHNVGAVLVNREGGVVSFALNRNIALNSSLEHAEARAVRNGIRLANANAGPQGPKRWSFGSILAEDLVYTTLEPCAQCAGIMDLARVSTVVYAQDDPGQRKVVDVIYNLQRTPTGQGAPLPIRAAFFPFWDQLAGAYQKFQDGAERAGALSGATSFLATVEAYEIYRDAARAFAAFTPRDPDNSALLAGARDFRARFAADIAQGVGPT